MSSLCSDLLDGRGARGGGSHLHQQETEREMERFKEGIKVERWRKGGNMRFENTVEKERTFVPLLVSAS